MKFRVFIISLLILFTASCKKENQTSSKIALEKNYSGPIIDMHIHAYSKESGGMLFNMKHPKTLRGKVYNGVSTPEEQREKTFWEFQKYNIVKAMVSDGELWYEHAPETIVIGGGSKSIEKLRKQFDEDRLHVIGELAPFYRGIMADDPSILPYFDLAQELGIPVGFHVLPGGPNGGIYTVGMKGMRAYNANPLQIEDVLVSHPDVRVYIMHGGWPYLENMKALMYAHPQVYIDISTINWILPIEEFHSYLKGFIKAGFGDRIMFGSDQMVWPETIAIGIHAVNSASFLNMQQKEDVFYNNAAKFLNLSKMEIKTHKKN